jgi:DNA-binding transcriptional LysR family regulator
VARLADRELYRAAAPARPPPRFIRSARSDIVHGMDRFEEMRTFAAVVDAGSFVGAAGALQRSKASVSRQVAELEARLGVRLLHRTTRRVSMTAEGELFHARCTALLAELDEAEAELTSRHDEAIGQLRINVPVSYGLLRLAPLWGAFMARHPRVTLEVTLSDRVVDLVDEGYDLAVRIARLADSSLVGRRLSSTRMVLCASPGYVARHGAPDRPSALARHAVLAYSLLSTGDTWRFEGPDGSESVRTQPRMRTNSGDTCRAVALRDQGIILQPDFIVGEDLRSGALVELMPRWRAGELGVNAVYPSRRHVPPKVRLMIDFLAEALRAPDA